MRQVQERGRPQRGTEEWESGLRVWVDSGARASITRSAKILFAVRYPW